MEGDRGSDSQTSCIFPLSSFHLPSIFPSHALSSSSPVLTRHPCLSRSIFGILFLLSCLFPSVCSRLTLSLRLSSNVSTRCLFRLFFSSVSTLLVFSLCLFPSVSLHMYCTYLPFLYYSCIYPLFFPSVSTLLVFSLCLFPSVSLHMYLPLPLYPPCSLPLSLQYMPLFLQCGDKIIHIYTDYERMN
jgi:hypothetical protein